MTSQSVRMKGDKIAAGEAAASPRRGEGEGFVSEKATWGADCSLTKVS